MTHFIASQKNIRLQNYDYHDGWFFITNQTRLYKPYIKDEIYNIVKTELLNLPNKYEGVKVDFFSLMSTHIHNILILNSSLLPLSEIWRRFKAVTTLIAKRAGLIDSSLWQENFYEHIIRNEKALVRIRQYIINNPLKVNLPFDEIYESPKDFKLIYH